MEAATADRIKDFLPPGSVGAATPAILANALYFKGIWERKFHSQLTRNSTFYLPADGKVRVPFMSSNEYQYIACCPDWKVLKLPYARGGVDEHWRRRFAMYVYLPNERHGLQSMLEKMASNPGLLEAGSVYLGRTCPSLRESTSLPCAAFFAVCNISTHGNVNIYRALYTVKGKRTVS